MQTGNKNEFEKKLKKKKESGEEGRKEWLFHALGGVGGGVRNE